MNPQTPAAVGGGAADSKQLRKQLRNLSKICRRKRSHVAALELRAGLEGIFEQLRSEALLFSKLQGMASDCAANGSIECLRVLREFGVPLEWSRPAEEFEGPGLFPDDDRHPPLNPLTAAAKGGHLEVAEWLLGADVNVDANSLARYHGGRALSALQAIDPDLDLIAKESMLRLLAHHGADFNPAFGKPPIMAAVESIGIEVRDCARACEQKAVS